MTKSRHTAIDSGRYFYPNGMSIYLLGHRKMFVVTCLFVFMILFCSNQLVVSNNFSDEIAIVEFTFDAANHLDSASFCEAEEGTFSLTNDGMFLV